RALAREISQAVFPRMPEGRLVAVRDERLRENLSHAHVVFDQEELHGPLPRSPATTLSSQGPREFLNVTTGAEDDILSANQRCVRFRQIAGSRPRDPARGWP